MGGKRAEFRVNVVLLDNLYLADTICHEDNVTCITVACSVNLLIKVCVAILSIIED